MKKKLTLIVLLVGVVLLAVGLSYAYFSAKITNNENTSTIISEAGTLSITLNGGASFSVGSILPGPDAWATKTITLTGNNSSKGNMPYSIKIVVDNNTFSTDAISYSITGTNTSNSGVVAPSVEYIPINETTTIGSGFFEKGNNKVHTYTISLYFLDTNTDQSIDMRATFNAHVEIVGEESEKPAPSGWWKASSETLLGAIRDNSVLHTDETGMTIPGQQIANTDEQLRMTLDDYGESFYFRGAVENNYVVFANKCWRIVRITGNGAIKLVLYNDNTNNLTDNLVCAETGYNLAFAKYDGTNYKTEFNPGKTAYAYIGFMYGTPNSNSFADEHKNLHDSIILTKLKQWYDLEGTFTTTEKNMLADVIWCNEKRIKQSINNYGYGSQSDNPYISFYSDVINNLSCYSFNNYNNINKNISKYTASDTINGNGDLNGYKIGLLTSKEIIFAGSANQNTIFNYYLIQNTAQNCYWWTLTPSHCNSGNVNCAIMGVQPSGKISSLNTNDSNHAIRPSVSLKPDTLATYTKNGEYAPGTVNNPYIVTVPQAQS